MTDNAWYDLVSDLDPVERAESYHSEWFDGYYYQIRRVNGKTVEAWAAREGGVYERVV